MVILNKLFKLSIFGIVTLSCYSCSSDNDSKNPNAGLAGASAEIIIDNPSVELIPSEAGNQPFVSALLFPLSEIAYEQQEFFLKGTANSYVNVGELSENGQWKVKPAEQADYTTRIIVYRPENDNDFNGTVILEWLNVSSDMDTAPGWIMTHTELTRSGYVWVGVSAQKAGIYGPDEDSFGLIALEMYLKKINEERYAPLIHPGDSFSYDIFSQAGQAIRHPQGLDPLADLNIEHIIASGESQSAIRLMTYVNAIGPHIDLFDAYLIHSRIGSGAPLSQTPQTLVELPSTLQVRTDLQTPTLMLMTQSDILLSMDGLAGSTAYASRQDDSDTFRLWEIAGTAHADLYTLKGLQDKGGDASFVAIEESYSPIPFFINCGSPINSGPQHFVTIAAIDSLNTWMRDDIAPAIAPRLEVVDEGDTLAFALDEHGNALGGIRTPHVDAPIATFTEVGTDVGEEVSFCFLFGTTNLFDSSKLTSLYPESNSYADAVSDSADAAVEAGFILQADTELIKGAALDFSWD